MDIQQTLAMINQMESEGIIGRYAIGGAVGATFYLEPIATLDVDIFVTFRPEPGKLILSAKPIYDYLLAQGCTTEGEYINIAGWPVQFLAPPTPLVEDALDSAVDLELEGVATRVFSAEHLAAIALETGRAKDKARLLQFVESNAIDMARFHSIVSHFQLLGAWQKFERQFLDSPA